ncbi:MAG: 3-ketoacyl-CoA thiolase, partial [Natronomonas sp.]|nr:3-ketoacyl-CoA thiolase [Natronomonas sp.]
MRDAYVVGAGQSKYGSFPDESYRSLFETAVQNTVSSVDHGIKTSEIDEAYVGTLGVGGRQLGLPGP